jgi:HEAT repeat protein
VEIRRVFPDAVLRLAVERPAGHADVEVRRTALQVLQHTLQSEGVALHDGKDADLGTLRGTYLNVLGGDADVSVRGEAAWGLANWLSVVPPEFAGQGAVADALIQAGLKEAEEPSRFRSLAGLKQAELRPEQLSRMAEASASISEGFEVRTWAIEVLGSKGEDLNGAQRAGLIALSGDRDGKLREVAVRSLAGLQGNEAARDAVRRALGDAEWNVRAAAAATVAALEGKEARARLEALATSDPREEVRIAAQRALKALVGP